MRPDFEKMNHMIPAVVQDVRTKKVLMLAYVNEEAYDFMLEKKETCFWSRSRNELWHKGETSGHFQYIKGMYLDCDNDTLLITVEQDTAACHTGSYSCFFNEVIPYDNDEVFNELYTIIEDGETVDAVSLIKESTSHIEEVCDNKEKLIEELGDLYFHTLELMSKSGIAPNEVETYLKKKYVPNNKKISYKKGN